MNINSLIEKSYLNIKKGDELVQEENILNIIDYLKSKNIIIYGAGNAGKKFYDSFIKLGIKIHFFVDKNFKYINNSNLEIKSPSILCDLKKDEYIIILASNENAIMSFMKKDIEKINNNLILLNGLQLNIILSSFICDLKLKNNEEHSNYECFNCRMDKVNCFLFQKLSERNRGTPYKNKSKFNYFAYTITTRCVLKCKDCLVLNPYLKNKQDEDIERILLHINKIVNSVNFLHNLCLTGGEPLLYKDLDKLLTNILKIENIGYIEIITTGLCIPSEKVLNIIEKNKRISLQISDYGKNVPISISKNQREVFKLLDERNIKYNCSINKTWLKFGNYEENKELSYDKLADAYSKCLWTSCIYLIDGVIYRCPYQCGGITTNKLENNNTVNVDLIPNENMIEELNKFMNYKTIDACKYCNIPVDKVEEVEAAIQL